MNIEYRQLMIQNRDAINLSACLSYMKYLHVYLAIVNNLSRNNFNGVTKMELAILNKFFHEYYK